MKIQLTWFLYLSNLLLGSLIHTGGPITLSWPPIPSFVSVWRIEVPSLSWVRDSHVVCSATEASLLRGCTKGDQIQRPSAPKMLSTGLPAVFPIRTSRIQNNVQRNYQEFFWQVTRSIGDGDLKPYVTAEPEITETILSVEDEYLVRSIDTIICCNLGFVICLNLSFTLVGREKNKWTMTNW